MILGLCVSAVVLADDKQLEQLCDEAVEHLWDDEPFAYVYHYERAARKAGNANHLAQSFRQRVYVYSIVRRDMDSAKLMLQQMQAECPKERSELFMAKKYILSGYEDRGEYNIAVSECRQLLNSTTDPKERVMVYMTLVELHNQTETFDQAIPTGFISR